jgi:hypothetical protein
VISDSSATAGAEGAVTATGADGTVFAGTEGTDTGADGAGGTELAGAGATSGAATTGASSLGFLRKKLNMGMILQSAGRHSRLHWIRMLPF